MMLKEIRDYLATAITSDSFSYGYMPDEPISVVTLYEYAGKPPEFTHDGKKLGHPGLQVIARGSDYKLVRERLEAIEAILNAVVNQSIGGTVYQRIFALQSAFPVPGWEKGHVRLAQNYGIERTEG